MATVDGSERGCAPGYSSWRGRRSAAGGMRWTASDGLPESIERMLESMGVKKAATELRPALWHDLVASGESLMSLVSRAGFRFPGSWLFGRGLRRRRRRSADPLRWMRQIRSGTGGCSGGDCDRGQVEERRSLDMCDCDEEVEGEGGRGRGRGEVAEDR